MADPKKFFSVRETGIGQFNISIKPERLNEIAEAMELIVRATAQTNKSEIVCDAILAYAASLKSSIGKSKR